jgi:hypothetical protein
LMSLDKEARLFNRCNNTCRGGHTTRSTITLTCSTGLCDNNNNNTHQPLLTGVGVAVDC